MRKFYKMAEKLMWSSIVVAFVVFPWLTANYSMI
nr:MAG TPA: hypothetical protein [Caudoviricetes sp.]